MLSFGMYYVLNNIYSQSVSRYIYYRQSKAYRRIVTGSHFLFICMCVGFYSAEESATEEMVSYGNYCYFLCDAIDALCGVEVLFALRAAPHKNTAPPFVGAERRHYLLLMVGLILVSICVSLQQLILYIGGNLLIRCELHCICCST